MKVLVTGAAGFIGFYLSKTLSEKGIDVYGIDSVNNYYDVALKQDRLKECGIYDYKYGEQKQSDKYPHYIFCHADLCDKTCMENIFRHHHFDCVINLAAQAGVRYSLSNPESYIQNNINGFANLLELCHQYHIQKLVYASSSSVYGNTVKPPYREDACVDHPVSIYAATKKSNELMAFTYSQLYGIQTIGLRFFSVYGPFGRPDMAPMLFAHAMQERKSIRVFNNGNLARDFTYISDIVEGITKIVCQPGIIREDLPGVPYVIYNIGHGSSVNLMEFIHLLEKNLGLTAHKEFIGMQPGDVYQTWADTTKLYEDYHYTPATTLEEGIQKFAEWFKQYYGKK